nr:capsule assembly Wzi family protein [uncultured Moellerella sp.]
MKINKLNKLVLIALFSAISGSAFAAGLVLPDNNLRNDLAWLSERNIIQISLSTWPLSSEEINRSLSNANITNSEQEAVVQRIKLQLNRSENTLQLQTYLSTDKPSTPQGFANSEYSDFRYTVAGSYNTDDIDIKLKANAERDLRAGNGSDFNLNGSYGATKIWNQWLSFGEIPQWWGPGYDGSLIRTDAARPVTGFMLQRADQSAFDSKWLSWIGSWQYQLTAGQLKQYPVQKHTKLIGLRMTMNPTDYLELGGSRMMMWAGDGRPSDWGSFWDAASGSSNTGDVAKDPGNQLAGFDFKLKLFPLIELPLSVYGQYTGEDEAGYLPSHNAYMLGLEGHHSLYGKPLNWYIEGADTRTEMKNNGVMYTHFVYKAGYYQQGYPLGHAMGGDGRMLSTKVEYTIADNQRISTRLVYAKVNPDNQWQNKAFPKDDTIKGMDLGWWYNYNDYVIADSKLWVSKTDTNESKDVGVSLGLTVPFKW